MSAEYVVLADHLILDPVDDTSGPSRHRRGEVVDLSALHANQVKHLKAQGAIAVKRSDDGKTAAAEPAPPPPLVINDPAIETGAASLIGAAVASGVVLDPSFGGDPAGAVVTDAGTPAKSATVEVWKAHAIKVGAVTEEESSGLTKDQLREKVAAHAAATAAG